MRLVLEGLNTKMNGNGKHFTIDQMLAHCERIRGFCAENDCEANRQLLENTEKLLKSARFMHKIAPEFFFERLPQNGFVTYLRIASAYIAKVSAQIEKQNKVDPDLLKLFALLFDCEAWLVDLVDELKSEKESRKLTSCSNDQHIIGRKFCLVSKHIYNLSK